jgi:hypothetical protein
VETTLLSTILFIVMVTLTFDLIGHRYYEYNFWQGRFRTLTLVLYIGSLTNLATWFPCVRGRTLFILGSLGQRSPLYTELKLSCGNDPVVNNSIYSNGDLWPNDPKINRVLPLPQGNHVAKFVKGHHYYK